MLSVVRPIGILLGRITPTVRHNARNDDRLLRPVLIHVKQQAKFSLYSQIGHEIGAHTALTGIIADASSSLTLDFP